MERRDRSIIREVKKKVTTTAWLTLPLLVACSSYQANEHDQAQALTPAPSAAGSTMLSPTSELVPSQEEEYELTKRLTRIGETGELVDVPLLKTGDRTIKRVEFSFDPGYAPGTAGGSLAMTICVEGNGRFRILSEEKKPRPGWLVDAEYHHGTECVTKHPVIELAKGDEEVVYLGVGEQTYDDMRTYEVKRTEQGLNGRFGGKNDVDPSKIQFRDKP